MLQALFVYIFRYVIIQEKNDYVNWTPKNMA